MNSRKLLLHNPVYESQSHPPNAGGHDPSYMGDTSFDANVVMILSVLLCALICALGLNSIVRCALRCSTRVTFIDGGASDTNNNNNNNASTRLANTGVKRKALKTFTVVTYSPDLNLPGLDTECSICLSEFSTGERLRVLPKCSHGFHIRCIDKWLLAHSSCPTCRHCLIDTCQKIVGRSQVTPSEPPPPVPVLQPLAPEGLIRSPQGIC